MRVIRARNVNDALVAGVKLLGEGGIEQESRAGTTIEYPEPVCTVYERPNERVLFDAIRDANPFFHLLESVWMLAGRRDVAWLERFNQRMATFSDDGEVFNAAYGYRWRNQFDLSRAYDEGTTDQLTAIVDLLKRDPDSRRAVLQIWDARADLAVNSKDLACNTQAMFKVRAGALNMTVSNRSNDMIWGCYGANAVHFSILLEYVASRLKLAVGVYRQVSDSFHAYRDTWGKVSEIEGRHAEDPYILNEVAPYPLMADAARFDDELDQWLAEPPDALDMANWQDQAGSGRWANPFFHEVATPLYKSWFAFKAKQYDDAAQWLGLCAASDWRRAGIEWLERRARKREQGQSDAGAPSDLHGRPAALLRLAGQDTSTLMRLARLVDGKTLVAEAANGKYLDWLGPVSSNDVSCLIDAERSYGDSWKRRGGVDSFAMLGRKWERIETALACQRTSISESAPFDIFEHIAASPEAGGLIDDVRDLRRYLMIIEAEARKRADEDVADSGSGYLDELDKLSRLDMDTIIEKEDAYGSSWKAAGGVRTFMMLARKWDRITLRVSADLLGDNGALCASKDNIFEHIAADDRNEDLLSDIAGLRQYLILVEAEMIVRGVLSPMGGRI